MRLCWACACACACACPCACPCQSISGDASNRCDNDVLTLLQTYVENYGTEPGRMHVFKTQGHFLCNQKSDIRNLSRQLLPTCSISFSFLAISALRSESGSEPATSSADASDAAASSASSGKPCSAGRVTKHQHHTTFKCKHHFITIP